MAGERSGWLKEGERSKADSGGGRRSRRRKRRSEVSSDEGDGETQEMLEAVDGRGGVVDSGARVRRKTMTGNSRERRGGEGGEGRGCRAVVVVAVVGLGLAVEQASGWCLCPSSQPPQAHAGTSGLEAAAAQAAGLPRRMTGDRESASPPAAATAE